MKSKILITTGMVWPFSSDKCKAPNIRDQSEIHGKLKLSHRDYQELAGGKC